MIAGMSAGRPYRCTGKIAAVREPISELTEAGSSVKSSEMSAKRATAPLRSIAFSVAPKVSGEVITSSPGPIPRTSSAASSVRVPFADRDCVRSPRHSRSQFLQLFHHGALCGSPASEDLEHQLFG